MHFDAGLGEEPNALGLAPGKRLPRRDSLGKIPKRDPTQLGQERRLPGFIGPVLRRLDLGHGHEVPVDRSVQLARGDIRILGENAELLRTDGVFPLVPRAGGKVHLAVIDHARIVLQVHVDEAIRRLTDVLSIGVIADADEAIDEVPGSVQAVKPFEAVDHPPVGIHRENTVLIAVGEQQRARRNQSRDMGPGPLKRIVQEHAVAVSVDDAIGDIGRQIGHAADGDRDLRALVGRRDPERGGSPAADAGHGEALRVHVRAAEQVIDTADSVEALDTGRRVTSRMPPPAALAVRAMVNGRNFAQLQSVEDQTDIAVPGEPQAMRLVGGLVAIATTE